MPPEAISVLLPAADTEIGDANIDVVETITTVEQIVED